MTDTTRLSEAISESGITIVAIARKIGISREGLYKKINNETEFKASEISALKRILQLTNAERDEIFFAKEVECDSTLGGEKERESMTWNEYLELQISRGAKPELAMNSIGHMMDLYESWDWDAKVPFEVKW